MLNMTFGKTNSFKVHVKLSPMEILAIAGAIVLGAVILF